MTWTTWRTVTLLVVILVVAVVASGVAAADDHDEDDEGGGPIIFRPNIDLHVDEVVSAIQDLADNLSNFKDSLADILRQVLFYPFRVFADAAADALAAILIQYPDVDDMDAVQEVHSATLAAAFGFATIGFLVAAVLFMIGPVLNVSYREARMVLPRLVTALAFATISPRLLAYVIRLFEVTAVAFMPDTIGISGILGVSVQLVVVWLLKSLLLAVVVILIWFTKVYVVFGVAVSPLLAVGWAVPKVKRYADTLISTWWVSLAIPVVEVLILRFNLALMRVDGFAEVGQWVLGVSAAALMLIVPVMLFNAGNAIVGQAYLVSSRLQTGVTRWRRQATSPNGTGGADSFSGSVRRRLRRRIRQNRRRNRRRNEDSEFDGGKFRHPDFYRDRTGDDRRGGRR